MITMTLMIMMIWAMSMIMMMYIMGNVRYSIGADDDFQHHSYPSAYPSAPTDNEPYNPGYYDRQVPRMYHMCCAMSGTG